MRPNDDPVLNPLRLLNKAAEEDFRRRIDIVESVFHRCVIREPGDSVDQVARSPRIIDRDVITFQVGELNLMLNYLVFQPEADSDAFPVLVWRYQG